MIDVQQNFIANAVNPDLRSILDRTKDIFRAAHKARTPFLITYEVSQSGIHDLPTDLKRERPPQQREFIKDTYAATGLKAFADAVRTSDVTHWAVLGSETDVCVLQTALGLKQMDYAVCVVRDAIFSSEANPGPALRYMQASGVGLIDCAELLKWIRGEEIPDLDPVSSTKYSPIERGAVLLNQFDPHRSSSYGEKFHNEKSIRMRELLHLAEVTNMPIFHLPAELDLLNAFDCNSVYVAGTDLELDRRLAQLHPGRNVFAIEDCIFQLSQKPAWMGYGPSPTKPFFTA